MSDGWTESADAWIDHLERGDTLRRDILDPLLPKWIADLNPANVLDVGCGEGRFVRMLSKQGLNAEGVDPTDALIEHAQKIIPGRYDDPESYITRPKSVVGGVVGGLDYTESWSRTRLAKL